MKSAALFITGLAVALVITSAVYADDEIPPKTAANDLRMSTNPVEFRDIGGTAPAESLENWSSSADSQPAPGGRSHLWGEPANHTPKVEWFLGYSFWRAMPTSDSNRMGYLHGGSTSVAYNFSRYFGLVADFGGFANSRLTLLSPAGSRTVDSNGRAYTYLFGPRLSYRRHERWTPFFEALFGGARATSVSVSGCTGDPSCTPLGSENTFSALFGTGLDIKLTRHLALRLVEGDFLLTHFRDPFAAGGDERGWQKNVRLSSGLVFRFGGSPRPPAVTPMSATCSADKEFVYAGSGDFVSVHVQSDSAERYPANYSWSASEGTVDGNGSEVRWNSAERRPGLYTVKARVENGHNSPADCSVNIRVEARPNQLPTIRCSADRLAVTVGDAVEITAVASDPDNDPLTFGWSASAGRIEGGESAARFLTADLAPGNYTVTGRVDDGRGGTADCTVTVDAQAAQIPQEVKELETRLALHSIYFATARPTVANPGSGLAESQEDVLLSLASDFHRYLAFKPQAHLILQGHADHRGTEEFNKALTERRVERTKGFLVEHDIPASNIETQARGEDDNLSSQQVSDLIEQNPELSNEERRRILGNLPVIVLANNRRVDVSLSTTGQQSVRQYPFNAKDSLSLLSPSAGQRQKRAPAKKKSVTP
jgi:outer membrane protein OmpA-like peptidoglycan-associated protein